MPFSKEIMKGSTEFIVLKVLDELGQAYGYQLMKAIEEMSTDIFKFQESTLYPLLYRLESKKIVQSEVRKAPSGKERRYYFLSPTGKKILKEKNKEMELYMKGMKKFLHLCN